MVNCNCLGHTVNISLNGKNKYGKRHESVRHTVTQYVPAIWQT